MPPMPSMITGPVARVRCAPTISSTPPVTIACTSRAAPGNRAAMVRAAVATAAASERPSRTPPASDLCAISADETLIATG